MRNLNQLINSTRFIVEMVCAGENVLSEQIYEKTDNEKLGRKREVVFARQIIMYLIKKTSRDSLAKIGSYFGQDHATASHAIKTVNNLVDTDKEIAARIDYYIDKINEISLMQRNVVIKKLSELQDVIRQKIEKKELISIDVIVIYNTMLEKEYSINKQINKNLSK